MKNNVFGCLVVMLIESDPNLEMFLKEMMWKKYAFYIWCYKYAQWLYSLQHKIFKGSDNFIPEAHLPCPVPDREQETTDVDIQSSLNA